MNTVELRFIGHAGTLLRHGDVLLAIDPFLSGTFLWNGKLNVYKGTSPWIGSEAKMQRFISDFGNQITAVLITHAHLDHFDPAALAMLFEHNPDIELHAPYPVIDWMKASSFADPIHTRFIAPVDWNATITIEGRDDTVNVHVMPNSGIQKEIQPYRVGYLVCTNGGQGIFFTGDSIVSNEWEERRHLVTHLVTWGKAINKGIVEYFKTAGTLNGVFINHWEPFTPGNFDCSQDPHEFMKIVKQHGINADVLKYDSWRVIDRP
nr:MBL fold metallo-hydrolase [Candidatus Sigynarchaeota archaeon]